MVQVRTQINLFAIKVVLSAATVIYLRTHKWRIIYNLVCLTCILSFLFNCIFNIPQFLISYVLLSLFPSQIASFYLFIYVLHLSFLSYFGNFFANLEKTLSHNSFSNLELFLISENIPKIQVFIHKNISYNHCIAPA